MPHFLHNYTTPTRLAYAVTDEFGNLIPCSLASFWHLFPEIQVTTRWN